MAHDPLPRQAILLVNARSRHGAEWFEQARGLLAAGGVELIETHVVGDPDQLQPLVKAAVGQAPMVIVGGGDGTLSSAVDEFLGSRTVFAVLPMGTANSFARALGIPLDLDGAVAVIAGGRPKRIDLGAIDGDSFVNSASIGLSPLVARTVPATLKRLLGRFGYLVWAVRCALRFRPFRLAIADGGQRHLLWSTEVRIANGGHFGGVELVETAELDSGAIVIEAVTGQSRLNLARSWFAAVLHMPRGQAETREFRGREFRIETRPKLYVSIDGELSKRTPIHVRVARGAVQVAAPRA